MDLAAGTLDGDGVGVEQDRREEMELVQSFRGEGRETDEKLDGSGRAEIDGVGSKTLVNLQVAVHRP
ncbi:hypothetical protein Bca52824_035045 [Brassica carinata]|uniref:Uncharacterized protein n=1 Tax=Brassica carinata TaxID=52824 RepID=A0A8X7S2F3_BRACI|nr:hypothetical protein Bca52824_035045 [Brassica carinata]